MAECLYCKRLIRIGRSCSGLHCIGQAQQQAANDWRAIQLNPNRTTTAKEGNDATTAIDDGR